MYNPASPAHLQQESEVSYTSHPESVPTTISSPSLRHFQSHLQASFQSISAAIRSISTENLHYSALISAISAISAHYHATISRNYSAVYPATTPNYSATTPFTTLRNYSASPALLRNVLSLLRNYWLNTLSAPTSTNLWKV